MTPGQASPYGSQSSAREGSSISLQTLLIASVASAVTSFTVSRIWGPGTLFSAAATPILVALVSELVRRPVQTAQKVAVAPLRYRPSTQSGDRPPAPGDPTLSQPLHPPTPAEAASAAAPDQWETAPEPPAVETRRTGPRWRLVLATGLLACVIVIGLFTALDVLAGQSISGNGDSTTIFGGHPAAKTTPTTTPTTPAVGSSGTTGSLGTSGTTGTTGPSAEAPPVVVPPTGTSGASGATTGPTGPSGATDQGSSSVPGAP